MSSAIEALRTGSHAQKQNAGNFSTQFMIPEREMRVAGSNPAECALVRILRSEV